MQHRRILNRGFIGLLSLLIGVVIIIFIIMRNDLFPGKKDSKNMIEQSQDYINKAKEVKNAVEQNNAKVTKELKDQ